MDLAIYISEVLSLNGEVTVPGLGRFSQKRMPGQYNEQEHKIYPPHHIISLDSQTPDDGDTLISYIADQKNISLASAQYFVEKYVAGIWQQVGTEDVLVAKLGWLTLEGQKLEFRPNIATNEGDPSFYGFAPLQIVKIAEQPVEGEVNGVQSVSTPEQPASTAELVHEPVSTLHLPVSAEEEMAHELADVSSAEGSPIQTESVVAPAVSATGDNAQPIEKEEVYAEEPRRTSNTWIITLIVLTVVGLAIFGVYTYKPDLFNKRVTPIVLPKKPVVQPAASDTVKQDSVAKQDTSVAAKKPDTLKSTTKPSASGTTATQGATVSNDTTARLHYEILAGSYKFEAEALADVERYKKIGLNPRVIKPEVKFKITLGTYFDENEAKKKKNDILSAHKKLDIYIKTYNPK